MQTTVQQRASASRQASARTSRMAVVPRASLRSVSISAGTPLAASARPASVRGAQRTSRSAKVVQVRALFGGAPKTAVTGSFYDFEVRHGRG